MHKANWDDIRYVLAVAETGSVSAAARALGVNHATVLRRVAAFEDRVGTPVFDRTARGYAVSADRLRLVEAAREVAGAVERAERLAGGVEAPPSGRVRITSTDTLCVTVLPGLLAGLRSAAAGLRPELVCSNAHVDLGRLRAEVAVRPASALPDDLAGTLAARLGFGVYATRDAPDRWLGLSGPLARSVPAEWLAGERGQESVAASADSFVTLLAMAEAGLGQAILPRILGAASRALVPREVGMPEISVPIWVASHADLADVPRIRLVRESLAEGLADRAELLLAGRAR